MLIIISNLEQRFEDPSTLLFNVRCSSPKLLRDILMKVGSLHALLDFRCDFDNIDMRRYRHMSTSI